MLGQSYIKIALVAVMGLGLSACGENTGTKSSLEGKASGGSEAAERDVEAPEVFQVNEQGLWDGRPSLGGVWVAHPTAKDPERVLIRNETNGMYVIGALFRKERETPGPKLQVSSDAAEAVGMIAGAPVEMTVTALRREEVVTEAPMEPVEEVTDAEGQVAPSEVTATTLDPIASAEAALDAVDGSVATAAPAAVLPVAKPASAPSSGSSKQSYLQVGIFSVEANANATAAKMKSANIDALIKKQTTQGKTFWRVIVGPASGSSEKDALKKTVNDLGYTDAYYVSS
ncbi:SPOR domain-containing protein [Falsihalocynthiibacter sp. SS001]|uniref:SPOR domain-containing protein n=1 Tax=Falsihalocynthiibacter sp. SS001 TaxID=3349698 RepID=UPI0036D30622